MKKKKFHIVKIFETEVSFDVIASDEDEARQLALEADKDDPLTNKDYRLSDEHVQSVTECMPTWHIQVVERRVRDVSVEAPTEIDARRLAESLYLNSEIVLDIRDLKNYAVLPHHELFDPDYSKPDFDWRDIGEEPKKKEEH